jgi:hypothetical protein
VLAQTETIFGPVWVWLVFGEQPAAPTLIGGAVIFVAVVSMAVQERERRKWSKLPDGGCIDVHVIRLGWSNGNVENTTSAGKRRPKSGVSLLLAELARHVNRNDFENDLALAEEAGLATIDQPHISRSQAAVLKRA